MMLRRFVAWARVRWSTRRKPARFNSGDIERAQRKELNDPMYNRDDSGMSGWGGRP